MSARATPRRMRRLAAAGRACLLVVLLVTSPWRATDATAAQALDQETITQILQWIDRGDLPAATQRLEAALATAPSDGLVLNLLGVVSAQRGDRAAAERRFTQAIDAMPALTAAYLNLARLHQEARASDPAAAERALAVYARLLARQPAHAEAHYQTATLLVERRAFAEALRHVEQLPPAQQGRTPVIALRAAALAGLDRRAEAVRDIERVRSAPDLTEADVLTIVSVLDAPALDPRAQGDLASPRPTVGAGDDLAVPLLEQAVARQVAGTATRHRLALAHERHGALQRAHDLLDMVANDRPDAVPVLVDLARVAWKQRAYQQALSYLAHARDVDPKQAGVHFFFGLVCVELNLVAEAYTSLEKAVSLEPDNPSFTYALGAVALHRHESSEAIPYFQRYCTLKPDDPRGRFALGAAYYYAGDLAAAKTDLERAASHTTTAPGAHYFLARVARQQQRDDEALAQVTRALALQPDFADALAERGLLQLRRGAYDEARRDLQRALTLDADHYEATVHLTALYQRTRDPRREAQTAALAALQHTRAERAQEFLRIIEAKPLEAPPDPPRD